MIIQPNKNLHFYGARRTVHSLILFILVLNLCYSKPIHAQIENEIRQFVDSNEILVNNGRKLLVQKIQAGDNQKAIEIFNFIQSKTSQNNCAAFYLEEELAIHTLAQNWDAWVLGAQTISNRPKSICYNQNFEILNILYDVLLIHYDSINQSLENAPIDSESKSVIALYLIVSKEGTNNELYTKKYKAFKSSYSPTKYEQFMDGFLPKPYKKYGMGWAIGSTLVFPTNDFSHMFNSNGTFYMALDFNFGKVYSSLHFSGGNLVLAEAFEATNSVQTITFDKGERFSYFDGGFKLGYFVVRNNYLHVAPYFNLAGTTLESNLYDGDANDNEVSIFNSFTYGPGIHTEFKVYESKAPDIAYYPYTYNMKGYFSFKMEMGYNIIASQPNKVFEGDIFYMNLALVIGLGDF